LTVELVEGKNLTRVFVQDTVLDFPRLNVITRDNASVYIDAVLSFKVVNPKLMLYSCTNLQAVLSKLLQVRSFCCQEVPLQHRLWQSMLRNLVSDIDVDQLVEDAGALNALTALMDEQVRQSFNS
jgi:regulator of protease activity HflC (stomatin/prohibitin superfamily)